jgi:hypothetical protein
MERATTLPRAVAWCKRILTVVLPLACLGVASPGAAIAFPLEWSSARSVDRLAPFGHATGISDVSCPSTTLCVAVAAKEVLVSSDPASGASAWTSARIDDGARLQAISCPSESLCVAVDRSGNVLVSTDPAGGAGAWSSTTVDPGRELTDVSCPSASLCVALGYGAAFVSRDPSGGKAAWSTHPAPPALGADLLSCPSQSRCVAMSGQGAVGILSLDSADAGAWSWGAQVDGTLLRDLSCPSVSVCVAVDENGDALVSHTLLDPGSRWVGTHVDAAPLRSVACASESLCVALDANGDETTSTDPAGGAGAWSSPANIDPEAGNSLDDGPLVAPGIRAPLGALPSAVSCPTRTLCVAADAYGHALSTTEPAAGAAAWRLSVAAAAADGLEAMSCPSRSLCAAIDDAGHVVTSGDPGSPHATWRVTTLPALVNAYRWGVTCAPRPLCVVFDTAYEYAPGLNQPVRALASIDPNGGPGAYS